MRIASLTYPLVALSSFVIGHPAAVAQPPSGIDPEALIEQILIVDSTQRTELRDVVFQTERIDGEYNDKEEFKEKARWIKKTFIKYLPDTALFKEEVLELTKDGKLKSAEDRDKEFATQLEKKKRRKGFDVSLNMVRPFFPRYRALYEITYQGVDPNKYADRICHHFTVTAKEKADSLINGEYYFEAENFHLVRVEFEPAKLVRSTMFKMNRLHMTLDYTPTPEGFWLPKEFSIRGKAKAMFFIGVQIASREYYKNPRINSGIKDQFFEVGHDE
ncbi:MAG: hypothetical protein AB1644_06515 [Candidatus Zixiibacteriota bacterium]